MKSSRKINYSNTRLSNKLEAFPLPKQVSIILPVYQEVQNLEVLIPEIDKVLSAAEISYELVIVDDNSADGTEELIERLSAEYPLQLVVRETEPRSLEQSVLKGLSLAKTQPAL